MSGKTQLKKNLISIIVISHRQIVVEFCDRIYYLENGQIVNQGVFEEMSQMMQ